MKFALFVSSVRGHVVARFGTPTLIGAHRVPEDPSEVVWDEETIVPLSEAEVARYRREYRRAIDGGALRQRTHEEYEAQVAARAKAKD